MTPERRTAMVPQQRWDPLQELEQVSDRMRKMLEDSLGSVSEAAWVPAVDIEETDDAYIVEAELPGVKRENVNIELAQNELSISGDIEEKVREGILRRRTRRVGKFEFRVRLPDQVDSDGVDANLDNGVLRVRVPKAQRAQRRRIEVKS